ncbi:hypothetical protein PA598K_01479 [Paenibacillus sp. 598K]|uniref:hypothetical protein n=1 Tax=Paenibacillus sp. 598K TaxID=1117987 RepID=UPI000FF98FF6|nr:hypothetical protein [Paenibacillus sp. 598K]GBF73194.1 hypothetical protein PA598K_01479 [Paenibacillus sp. 598K]
MMKVKIKETGAMETLSMLSSNGTDAAADMIGNHGGFGSESWQFDLDADTGIYEASQETYDWWEKVLTENEELEERIEALKEEHGSDAVQEVIEAAGNVDLEDHAANLNNALDEAFSGN